MRRVGRWSGLLKTLDWSSLRGSGAYGPRHLKLAFEEFEFGHIYKRVREDTDETNQHWTVGVVALWPNAFFLGDHIEWRVPVDDENTLSITWMFHRVPKEKEPYQHLSEIRMGGLAQHDDPEVAAAEMLLRTIGNTALADPGGDVLVEHMRVDPAPSSAI